MPLLPWFKNELNSKINNYWLDDKLIRRQELFNPQEISNLKKKITSSNPGDIQAIIWALIVFQHWWIKNFD